MTLPFPYEERYVAFIDILGFREKVRDIERHAQLFQMLLNVKRHITDSMEFANDVFGEIDAQGTAFSDSIVFSTRVTGKGMGVIHTVLNATTSMCQSLLRAGALTRGGIAKGPCFHQNDVLFGAAIVTAYQLEQTAARIPRVVVAPDVAREWRALFSNPDGLVALEHVIKRDADALDYVDLFYLPDGDTIDNATYHFCHEARAVLVAHLNDAQLSLHDWAKSAWLADKFNRAPIRGRLKIAPIDVPPFPG